MIAIERYARIIDALLIARAGEFARFAGRSANTEGACRSHRTRRRRIGKAVAIVIETVADIEAWFHRAYALERAICAKPTAGDTRRFVIWGDRRITRHADLRIIGCAATGNPGVYTNAARTRTRIGGARIRVIALPVDIATCRLNRIRTRERHRIANVYRAEIGIGAIGIRLTAARNGSA